MAHYAKLDENNIVTDVIVITNEDCLDENGNECEETGRRMCEALTGHTNWKKTSFNTIKGAYYDNLTEQLHEDQTKKYRLNFAQVGMRYDEGLDGFVVTELFLPKPIPRAVVNPKHGFWGTPKPDIPKPIDLELDKYPLDVYHEPWIWIEDDYKWIKVKNSEMFLPNDFMDE